MFEVRTTPGRINIEEAEQKDAPPVENRTILLSLHSSLKGNTTIFIDENMKRNWRTPDLLDL